MKKVISIIMIVVFVAVSASIVMAKSNANNHYVCGCDTCKCNSVSDKPGKCGCKKDMVQMHLISIKGDTATFCTCGGDCSCKPNADDPSKCGCGKQLKTVNIKGKYVCACGDTCNCGVISDKPGKCGCGKPLKKVE